MTDETNPHAIVIAHLLDGLVTDELAASKALEEAREYSRAVGRAESARQFYARRALATRAAVETLGGTAPDPSTSDPWALHIAHTPPEGMHPERALPTEPGFYALAGPNPNETDPLMQRHEDGTWSVMDDELGPRRVRVLLLDEGARLVRVDSNDAKTRAGVNR